MCADMGGGGAVSDLTRTLHFPVHVTKRSFQVFVSVASSLAAALFEIFFPPGGSLVGSLGQSPSFVSQFLLLLRSQAGCSPDMPALRNQTAAGDEILHELR